MVIVSGIIEAATEAEIDRVKEIPVRRVEKSWADEVCLDYVFSVRVDRPKEIRLFETRESEELPNAHLMVPDEEFNLMLAKADIVSAEVEMHEVSGSRELMRR
jgi:quinol monooxygenase YgiN